MSGHNGRYPTCRFSPSCLNYLLPVNYSSIWLLSTYFRSCSLHIELIILRRLLFSRCLATLCQQSTVEISLYWQCWTCQRPSTRRPYDFTSASKHILWSYGLQGSTLHWFLSYLHGRTQSVLCGPSSSTSGPVLCGVPQGSVLGPTPATCLLTDVTLAFTTHFLTDMTLHSLLPDRRDPLVPTAWPTRLSTTCFLTDVTLYYTHFLFLLYTADLLQLIQHHGRNPHLYADDTQIYCFFRPGNTTRLQSLMSCVCDVASWTQSKLLIPDTPLIVVVDDVLPAHSVRNLAIYIDSDVAMPIHVAKTASSCFCALQQIRSIRRTVSKHVRCPLSSPWCLPDWTTVAPL